ncbi:MAG TPA: helix-turn-helix transcriptional regulator [Candidatus Anaerobutyricum faecale]|uniref:helix-turn-helix transcriptional regulator n=1 Tax=Eubacterium sp. An11 TaxID=1965542 RepID=UPI000B395AAB|nr:helix-turn-helix transcriptional regulator [Eubacterium sp. An11]OUQ63998.1 transcriptional regulator [Eubacterium sp. An11]HJC32783.1 helix-turn-helix transcriptional regulator [Candidatus Anaerobutyricum faecale]
MNLGKNLFQARKKKGLSQEAVAEKLGVSRQTIFKWETDETLPDIRQAKKLAVLYGLTLDELIEFDADVQEIQEVINKTTEETVNKVDWTKMWAEKYPILARYQDEVDVAGYEEQLQKILFDMEKEYGYNALDAFLVLKDILGQLWNKQADE